MHDLHINILNCLNSTLQTCLAMLKTSMAHIIVSCPVPLDGVWHALQCLQRYKFLGMMIRDQRSIVKQERLPISRNLRALQVFQACPIHSHPKNHKNYINYHIPPTSCPFNNLSGKSSVEQLSASPIILNEPN